MKVFKDDFGDAIKIIAEDDGRVGIEAQNDNAWTEMVLSPQVAMDVAAAIVRAVHGDPP